MPRRPLTVTAAVLTAALALGACSAGSVDRQGARDRARDILVERLSEDEANDAASCIADGMFNDTDVLSPEERNEVLTALDGEQPPGNLTDRVVALVAECGALPDGPGGSGGRGGSDDEPDAAPGGDDASEDEGSTTTTEG